MLNIIDNFLNKITMYKIVLYYLSALWVVAFILSFFGKVPHTPISMLITLFILLIVAWATNNIFAYIYKVPANIESIYITVLILALIITPVTTPTGYIFLGWASIWAMASKYILNLRHKHIFNPAAFAVALTAFTINGTASWWIATIWMAPFVLIGGLLIIRKIKRTDLALSFFITALLAIIITSIMKNGNFLNTFYRTIFDTPILFFTFIMITEPLTTPPSRYLQIIYGVLVGILFIPQIHIGQIFSTPELALLVGNIFVYLVSPKARLILKLKEIIKLTPDTNEFIFEPADKWSKVKFKPGQYLEWTLGHERVDMRGNRRYFTIASSPTEPDIRLGVKFYNPASSFKNKLNELQIGETIIASQLSGDFVIPNDKSKKLVFVAGGIGVTPFRAMVKYIIDKREDRDIVMMYANKTAPDIAYNGFFEYATKIFKFKLINILSDKNNIPNNWAGRVGYINANMIEEDIPDYRERIFYISGPHVMVSATVTTLKELGLPSSHIKTDYFPGF